MFALTSRVLVAVTVAVVGVGGCAAGGGGSEAGPGRGGGPAASVSPEASKAAVRRPRIPRGVRAGYMVFDRKIGKVTAHHDAHGTVRSASVVKILIAVDHLEARGAGRGVSAGDRALLRGMLRSSDDRAATVLWARGGRGAIVRRMAARMRLVDTAPPPATHPGFWGYTAISAYDVVRMYRYLLERADPGIRRFVLGELHRATRCGKDGFDQYFGIPRALPRPWAIKQGWSGFGTVPADPCKGGRAAGLRLRPASAPDLGLGRPVLHTTGTVGEGDRRIVVVLTLQPAGGSFKSAASRLTSLTAQVHRAGGG
ncbi:hypothetical protein [Thermomonospora umbrina]|uniref:Beta-lactamase family protein n=1 Tax=Thermomonospora umbrina TaxID=111806 RepID=A0A3D9SVP3_9ACTN|nr:hypothetical protein [Thermomonospora umbrina]REF00030.1 hypothetical protein DFJ69_5551 [Thermomonospora umbrina]